jgi:hypothetical protein
LLFLSGAVAGASAIAGCGGIDCAETATCLDTSDGSAEDQSVEETSASETGSSDGGDASDGDASDGDATIADGDSGHDGALDADSASSDAADADGGGRDAGDAGDADADAANGADASDGCVAAAHEDCTNGKDDNCNGLVDCADPDCTNPQPPQQPFACVPAWPNGWIAPVAFYDNGGGPPAPSPPSCGAPYSNDVADGHLTPVAGADPCTCNCGGGVQGATCSNPFVALYTGNSTCTGGSAFASFVGTACSQIAPQGGINGAQMVDAGVASGGSCTPQSNVTPPTWNSSTGWTRSEKVCSLPTTHAYLPAPQNGCDAGQFCAEVPPSTFSSKACLYQTGQPTSCPAGYTVKTTFFDAGVDTRGCSGSCLCGGPTGVTCSTHVTLLAGSCSAGTNPQPLTDTSCLPLSNYGGSAVSASMTQTIGGGSCQVTSALTPAGGITPTNPATVCCPP